MIIYVPKVIEIVEEAESLPIDTLALDFRRDSFGCQKLGPNEWSTVGSEGSWSNDDMVGWTALVPVDVTLRGSDIRYGVLEEADILRIPEPGEAGGAWYEWAEYSVGWVRV